MYLQFIKLLCYFSVRWIFSIEIHKLNAQTKHFRNNEGREDSKWIIYSE